MKLKMIVLSVKKMEIFLKIYVNLVYFNLYFYTIPDYIIIYSRVKDNSVEKTGCSNYSLYKCLNDYVIF